MNFWWILNIIMCFAIVHFSIFVPRLRSEPQKPSGVSVIVSRCTPQPCDTKYSTSEMHTIVILLRSDIPQLLDNYAAFGYLILLSNYADPIFFPTTKILIFPRKLVGSPPTPPLKTPEVMPLMAGFFGIGVTVRSITRAGTRKPVFNVAG